MWYSNGRIGRGRRLKTRKLKLSRLQRKLILILGGLLFAILILLFILVFRDNGKRPGGSPQSTAETIEEAVSEGLAAHGHVTNTELYSAAGIEIAHRHIPWGSPRRPGEIREIKYITIHETDNRRTSAGASAHGSLLSENVSEITSWHYTVDDSEIIHHLPDNEIAWNAGDNRTKDGGNINGIGIEMCVNLSNDFEQTLRNTAELAAELLIAYDLDMNAVHFHEDFMVKECPHRLISEGRTEEFLEMIRDAYVRKLNEPEQAEENTSESGE